MDHLNAQHPYIKFTAKYDPTTRSAPFLDMEVRIDENNLIETDLHKKETAKAQYLLPSSCHPRHVSKNIPYSLGYRLLRLCSNPADFHKRLGELSLDLQSRNYHPKIISDAFERVRKIPRSTALKKVEHNKTDRRTFVIRYHPALASASSTVRKHWKTMSDLSPQLKRCFKEPPVIAFKRPKNLRDHLVRANLPKVRPNRHLNGYRVCKRSCWACAHAHIGPNETVHTHKCLRTNQEWKITSPLNCESRNVVYKLACLKCPFWTYIGETSRRFADRLTDHRSSIKCKELKHPVGQHFNQGSHQLSDLVAIAIERVHPSGNARVRKTRESLWISRYDSASFGGNRRK